MQERGDEGDRFDSGGECRGIECMEIKRARSDSGRMEGVQEGEASRAQEVRR